MQAMWWLALGTTLLVCGTAYAGRIVCELPKELAEEIQGYQPMVYKLIKETTAGNYSGRLYEDLAAFVDAFGHRLSGSKLLEMSIKHLHKRLTDENMTTMLDPVTVPTWTRGKAVAYIVTRLRKKKFRIKALGSSVAGNVTAPLLIVNSTEEMKPDTVKGKIVLFNSVFTEYKETVKARNEGPSRASAMGALGALVRSVTPFSIGSHHLGMTTFKKGVKPIPAAVVTLEDADMLARLYKSNETVSINMEISLSPNSNDRQSYNLITDIKGRTDPKSYVIVSGHIDNWDIGQGALDDGGGAFLAMHSLLLLKAMKVSPPKRTLRSILWTAEEVGCVGAKTYLETHKEELQNWTAAFESDEGLFQPLGFSIAGNKDAVCIIQEILNLYKEINATQVDKKEDIGSDINIFRSLGFPRFQPYMLENRYFWFYHTEGDSMRVLNSTIMDQHLALLTGTAYILANLSIPLPKENQTASDLLVEMTKVTSNNG